MAESDYREVTVEEPTTYFDLADVEGSDLDGWRLAAYNGVTNSRYDLDAGTVVRIPKGTVPVVADPPAIDADEAGRRYEKTRAAAEATVAGAAGHPRVQELHPRGLMRYVYGGRHVRPRR